MIGRQRIHSGFTLVELLAVILILTILASLVLVSLRDVREIAKESRTKGQITRINDLIQERYESYLTHPVRIPNVNRNTAALARLRAIRELMRKELPDRKSDVVNTAGTQQSMVWNSYKRRALQATGGNLGNWTTEFEGAECLYLILSTMSVGENSALEFFHASEIGDTDGDGMFEILDAWGTPIQFIRWAPGYSDPSVGMSAIQVADRVNHPDPFDQLHADPRWKSESVADQSGYRLVPLIISAGSDQVFDIKFDPAISYAANGSTPDPYAPTSGDPAGLPDVTANGWADNISNHLSEGE